MAMAVHTWRHPNHAGSERGLSGNSEGAVAQRIAPPCRNGWMTLRPSTEFNRHKAAVPPSVAPAHSLWLRGIAALMRPLQMFPKPKPLLVPNTYAYESEPMVKATGFREYDARWLFGKEINL